MFVGIIIYQLKMKNGFMICISEVNLEYFCELPRRSFIMENTEGFFPLARVFADKCFNFFNNIRETKDRIFVFDFFISLWKYSPLYYHLSTEDETGFYDLVYRK